jgi:hypothetical protein
VAKVLGPSVEDIRMNFVKCSALYGVYHDKHTKVLLGLKFMILVSVYIFLLDINLGT